MAKKILITGATGNLGSAVVDHLHDKGHQLIGTARPGKTKSSEKIDLFECDLTNEESVDSCFAKIREEYEQIDAAILLAGGFGMGNLLESGKQDVLKMYELNFMTAYLTSRACARWMNTTNGGRIIFTGAKPAIEGGGSAVLPYALAKGAVAALADAINEDDSLKSIHAAVIVPSIIDTPPNREGMPDANFDDWVTPEEIAVNIGYLISDQAKVLRSTVLKLYHNA